MDKERMEYIIKNQRVWEQMYLKEQAEMRAIKLILARRWRSRQQQSIEWIKKELQRALDVGELELIPALSKRGFINLTFLG